MLTDHGRPSRLWGAILAIACPGLGHRYVGRGAAAGLLAGVAILPTALLAGNLVAAMGALGPAVAYGALFFVPGAVTIAGAVELLVRWDEDGDDVAGLAPIAAHAGLVGLLAATVAFVVPLYAIDRYVVPSTSMSPLLRPGDALHVDPHVSAATLRRGDVVVVREPRADGAESLLVKRIVGLPGDRLAFTGAALTESPSAVRSCTAVDGTPTAVECLADRCYAVTLAADGAPLLERYEVGANEIFLAGDLRGNSEDSRARRRLGLPPISPADVLGRVVAHRSPGGALAAVDVDRGGNPYRCPDGR